MYAGLMRRVFMNDEARIQGCGGAHSGFRRRVFRGKEARMRRRVFRGDEVHIQGEKAPN